jgi:hypothetical protein
MANDRQITEAYLRELANMSPEEAVKVIRIAKQQLALQAQEREQEQAGELAGMSASDLQQRLERLRRSGHPDRQQYNQVYAAYQNAVSGQNMQPQQQPPTSGRNRDQVGADLASVQQKLAAMRAQPSYKIHKGEYSKLVDEQARLITEIQTAPAAPPAQPRPKSRLEELQELLGEDGEDDE